MCLCVLIFKTDCVSLFLSILTIVQFSDGRGYEIEPFLLLLSTTKCFFISWHSNLIFVGLVLLLSGFSWNSIPVELTLVLLEVKHLASLMGCAT
jgi:hypothetical protein